MATDDAALLEAMGKRVAIVAGSEDNIKLTYAEDLLRLERIMTARMFPRARHGVRCPMQLQAGRPLVLCGVTVPYQLGLAGHSDADVGIHALCDAIYGALAEGDIRAALSAFRGLSVKDADSTRFLAHAAERIAARGGQIGKRRASR